jgi:transporter family-2 protein
MSLALIAGIFFAIQLGFNAYLNEFVQSSLQTTIISFIVGLGALLILLIIMQDLQINFTTLKKAPNYAYIGGAFGAVAVVFTIILTPHIGIGLTLSLVVAGQILCSLLLDHYGLFGLPTQSINFMRLLGASMLVGGTFLIKYF